MMHWLAMGGYAIYVWPAYAVFVVVLAWDWFAPALRRRRITRELRGRIARHAARDIRTTHAETAP